MPRPRCARGRCRTGSGAGAAADQGGHAGGDGVIHLLRADEMNVRINAAGSEDLALTRDDLGAGTDDDIDARLHVGIAGLADFEDAAVLDGDVCLHDPPMIDNQRIGNNGIHRPLRLGELRLPHPVANDLAAAEFHFLTVDRQVAFDLDNQIGIGEAHAIPGGGAEHVRISGAGNAGH